MHLSIGGHSTGSQDGQRRRQWKADSLRETHDGQQGVTMTRNERKQVVHCNWFVNQYIVLRNNAEDAKRF